VRYTLCSSHNTFLLKHGRCDSVPFTTGKLSQGAGATALVQSLASWTEVAVGASLIAIGALGMNEARLWTAEEAPLELSLPEAPGIPRRGGNRAVLLNGILHGFSWDGTPSLAPALALPSIGGAFIFLLSYCVGTVVAMATATALIGEGSLRVGEKLDRPDLPQKLSFVSSALAALVGCIWTSRALPRLFLRG